MKVKILEGETHLELLLTIKQRIKLRNVFHNNISVDIKLSKVQPSKITLLGGFLGGLLNKSASPLMKIAKLLTKNISVPLTVTASTSAIDTGIQKKICGSCLKLLTSNKEINDIMKTIISLEDSNVL